MSNTIAAARQIVFDAQFVRQVKLLESLASPGSFATFDGHGNHLSVTFHGKEVEVRRRFEMPCEEFSFSIKGKDIMDILKCFDEGTVTVREASLSFKAGHAKMNRNLATDVPASLFPDFGEANLSPIPQTTFRDAVYASYAVAQGGGDDAAERVSILLKDGEVSIVASNGILGVCVASPSEYSGEESEYLLHPRIINPLAPLTSKDDSPRLYIGSTEKRYLIKFGDIEISSLRPAMATKRYNITEAMAALAKQPAMVATFDTADLRLYFERAKLLDVGTAQVKPVVFLVNPNEQVACAKHASALGDIQDMFDVEVSGTPIPNTPIGFSLKYMADILGHIKSEQAPLEIRGQLKPVLITEEIGDANVTHFLLPVRPQGQPQEESKAVSESAPVAQAETTEKTGPIPEPVTPNPEPDTSEFDSDF